MSCLKYFFIVGILLTNISLLSAQFLEDKDVSLEPRKIVWSYETLTWKTAGTVAKGELHLSALAPIRYGLSSNIELQSYPILLLMVTPNISMKISWYDYDRWKVATKHGIVYPRWGLNLLKSQRSDILREDAKVPQIYMLQNELILSYILNPTCNKETPHWIATGRFGVDFSIAKKRDASFHRMSFLSLYHRTAPFYKDVLGYLGGQLDGKILRKIYFNLGADIYGVNFSNLHAIEAQANLIYHHNYRLSVLLGGKYIKNMNKYSNDMHLFPTIDICYRLWRKGELYMGLF